MTIEKQRLREELSNPAIGSNAHLRKLALALLDELESAEKQSAVRLEALDNRIAELNTMRYRIKTLNGTVDIVDGQRDRWMERCKDAEAKLEAAEKRIAELERDETQLIKERDSAEKALADMYEVAMGERPEWSNLFGYAEAIDDVAQHTNLLDLAAVTGKGE